MTSILIYAPHEIRQSAATPYIPASYQSRYANPKITEFEKVQGGKIVSKAKMPDRTGCINLHRLGRFRDRSQENLSIRASALNLVVTAIIHWNTIYTGRVVDALHGAGQSVPNHLLSSLSPLSWEHVNLTVDYIWEDNPTLDDSGFRSLPFPV